MMERIAVEPPPADGTPDFAALYVEDDEGVIALTPPMAFALWLACGFCYRLYREDRELLLQDLPPSVRTRADEVWLDRFVRCFDDLSRRLAQGDVRAPGLARCTGEEYALHLVFASVEAAIADSTLLAPEEMGLDLPVLEEDADADWVARAADLLLEDDDVTVLLDPSLDGVKDDEELTALARTVNLRPGRWFLPFADS